MGESGLGLLDAVLGVGGILGGFVVLVLARRQRLASDFGIGVILWAAPLLLIAAVPSLATTLVAMFLIGLANSIVDVNAYTIVQRVAPAEVMGRVFGALESLLTVGMAARRAGHAAADRARRAAHGVGDRRRGGDPRRAGRSRRACGGSTRPPWRPPAWTSSAACRCSPCCRHRCRNAWPTCSCRPPCRPARWSSAKATGATGSGSSSDGEAVVSIDGEAVRQLGAGRLVRGDRPAARRPAHRHRPGRRRGSRPPGPGSRRVPSRRHRPRRGLRGRRRRRRAVAGARLTRSSRGSALGDRRSCDSRRRGGQVRRRDRAAAGSRAGGDRSCLGDRPARPPPESPAAARNSAWSSSPWARW